MKKKYEVIVIGGGISSLTSAALLAKKGLSVALFERNDYPGGSCGAFRLKGRTVDQGTAMMFGFGESGFNPHRFVFNELEEDIEIIRHEYLYRLIYDGFPILFHKNFEDYFTRLQTLFPDAIDQIRAFYSYIDDLYTHVIAADSTYLSPSEMKMSDNLKTLLIHPLRLMKLLPLLKKSAGSVVRKFIKDEEVIKYFSKLTSTYCYTLLDETPAILAITMFIENHVGGSFYPLGGSLQVPLKLEKAGEKYGVDYYYRHLVTKILFENNKPIGVHIKTGNEEFDVFADNIIYGGVLKPLYTDMIDKKYIDPKRVEKVLALEMSYPSIALYCVVDKKGLPEGTLPIEMMGDEPDKLDEKEITTYAFSLSDPSICNEDEHIVTAIGPSLRSWPHPTEKMNQKEAYDKQKKEEIQRMLASMDAHYPHFSEHVKEVVLATPTTIENFTLKEKGAVVGPKQRIGQDLLNRHHAQGEWDSFYFVGESTVMGTGSPAVTISGISAANLILRKMKEKEFRYNEHTKERVKLYEHSGPSLRKEGNRVIPSLNAIKEDKLILMHDKATLCQWCISMPCVNACPAKYEIVHIMRKLESGNILGAKKALTLDGKTTLACKDCDSLCEKVCVAQEIHGKVVPIKQLNEMITAYGE
ncbi:MAG: NAD(P)/FAD-dependent oxidoreductase [Spirochaetia bacterium]|nr:NAD(P)/FAD-dependent oxidoreductase [Spirochaetia bacterium]